MKTHFETGKGVGIQGDLKEKVDKWTISRISFWENDIFTHDVKIENIPYK